MSAVGEILFTLLLIALNASFVAAEFALISSRKDRLESILESGDTRAQVVINAAENLSMNLAGAQFGVTLASLLLGKVGEPTVSRVIETPVNLVGVPEELIHPLGFALALLMVSILHIILGEMVPKNIALAGPENVAMWLIPFHVMFVKVTRPIILFFNWVARITLAAFNIEQKDELDSTVSSSELARMITDSRQEGLIDAEEHSRLNKALMSPRRHIDEVLIPADAVRTVPLRGTGPLMGDVEDAVADTGFSRFPVTGRDGTYLGYIHVKDILDREISPTADPTTVLARNEIRPLMTFAPSTPIDQALRHMRGRSRHIAQVVDGGHQYGIVTLEDLIEEYVGTVRDSTHDDYDA
ncbi:hemolysin family protein [Corynebacterium kroppenstedtii]